MTIEEVNKIALLKGVEPEGKPKWQIIREIQLAEGFEPCFGTKQFSCRQGDCLWRGDCQGKMRLLDVIMIGLIMSLLGQ